MDRETKTVRLMIELYCRDHHGSRGLCDACGQLADYAVQRIVKCPFGPEKPTCSDCTVHCFKPDMRAQIREVMRYAGPRMSLHHPLLALDHLKRKLKTRPSRS
jgi:hypothetical protein